MINLKTIVFVVWGGTVAFTYAVMWIAFACEINDYNALMPKVWLALHCLLALGAIVWLFAR